MSWQECVVFHFFKIGDLSWQPQVSQDRVPWTCLYSLHYRVHGTFIHILVSIPRHNPVGYSVNQLRSHWLSTTLFYCCICCIIRVCFQILVRDTLRDLFATGHAVVCGLMSFPGSIWSLNLLWNSSSAIITDIKIADTHSNYMLSSEAVQMLRPDYTLADCSV